MPKRQDALHRKKLEQAVKLWEARLGTATTLSRRFGLNVSAMYRARRAMRAGYPPGFGGKRSRLNVQETTLLRQKLRKSLSERKPVTPFLVRIEAWFRFFFCNLSYYFYLGSQDSSTERSRKP